MKAILYIGAFLMTGASVYGFIDYKKSNRSKDLNDLYETKKQEVALQDEKATASPREQKLQTSKTEKANEPAAKTSANIKRSMPVTVPEVVAEPPKIAAPENIPVAIEEPEAPKSPEASIKENDERKKITTTKKRKKVNHKMFSRAPLDEKYLEKEKLIEEPSKGTITVEKKKQ